MTAWQERAACAGQATAAHDPWSEPEHEAEAKAVCAGCPVSAQCLADGAGDGWTVRAGRSAEERAAVDSDALFAGPVVEVEEQHGTRTARNAGCACERCRRAHAAYVAEWRRRVTAPVEWEQTAIDLGATA